MRTRTIGVVELLFGAVAMVPATGCDVAWSCKTRAIIEVTNTATGEPAGDVQVGFFALTPLQQVDDNLRALLLDVDLWSTVVTDTQGHATLPLDVGFYGAPPPWNPDYGTCGGDPYLADRVLLRVGGQSDSVELLLQQGAGTVIETYAIRVLEVEAWEAESP